MQNVALASGAQLFRWAWLRKALLPGVLVGFGLIPLWAVRYVALNDYPNHLLEAQVVARYNAPALAYAPDYQIRQGWYLRSNALSTILMATLAYVMPIELAGKGVLSLYVILLTIGLTALLDELGRPRWLLLALPIWLFNMPFTSGFLNWCYGWALIPYAWLCYRRWQQGVRWGLAALTLVILLIYAAHVLAWGLCLILLCAFAVAEGMPLSRYVLLTVALSGALPMLVVTRPIYALAPAGIAAALWLAALFIRRFRPSPALITLAAGGTAFLFLAVTRVFKDRLARLLPDIDYNLHDKLYTLPRTFTLPYQQPPLQWDVVGANIVVLALLGLIAGILFWSSVVSQRAQPQEGGGWLAALGLLGLSYLILPARMPDIITVEPRILLTAWVIALPLVRVPSVGSVLHRVLVGLHVTLAILSFSTMLVYAWRYDQTAHAYSRELALIPPARRVMVVINQLDVPSGGWYDVMRFVTRYTGHHFVSMYALENGGYISSAFFNGPLQSSYPDLRPSSWYTFNNVEFVMERCERIRTVYDYVVVWNPSGATLLQALRDCGGQPIHTGAVISIWEWQPR